MIWSNQKEILAKEIGFYIDRFMPDSLLDIGAGDGVLAEVLAKKVRRYTAIEKDKGNVKKLEGLGLEVTEGYFPVPALDRYDMVLSSHSVPESEEEISKFLDEAWKLVNLRGVLLIVTFKGGKIDVSEFLESKKKETFIFDKQLFEIIVKKMERFGSLDIYRSKSEFESDNLDELVDLVLASIADDDNTDLNIKSYIKRVIASKYKKDNGFYFPFEHIFLCAQKICE